MFTIGSGEKTRLIFDCRFLNRFIKKNKFLQEDLRNVQKIVRPGDYFAKIDLKKAYHQIVIHPQFRRHLGLMINGRQFHFRVLPFGLSSAPMILTKALKPLVASLRARGIRLSIYLDDILITASSQDTLRSHVASTVQELNSRGWRINYRKSSLSPSQEITYIGAKIKSNPVVSLNLLEEHLRSLHQAVNSVIRSHNISVYLGRRVLGIVNWALRFQDLFKTHRILIQKELAQAIRLNQKSVSFSKEAKDRLALLLPTSITDFTLEANSSPELVVSPDASLEILAASIRDDSKIIDSSSIVDRTMDPINVKEARAVLLAVQRFQDLFVDKKVAFLIDNQAVMYCLRSASAVNPKVQRIVDEIYRLLIRVAPKRVWFAYVPSKANVLADRLSRPDGETWSLNRSVLSQVAIATRFRPEIELFADESNRILPDFVALYPNRRALAVDAFSINWSRLPPLYANPPFSLLGRVLQKILEDRPEIMLIAPLWQSRPWYPMLLQADQLFRLPRFKNLFSFLGKEFRAPNWQAVVAIFRRHPKIKFREAHQRRIPLLHLTPPFGPMQDHLDPFGIMPPVFSRDFGLLKHHPQTDLVALKAYLQPHLRKMKSSIVN
jgi:hypothetical protein